MLRPISQNSTTVEKIRTTIEPVIPNLKSFDTAASKGDRDRDLSVSAAEASERKPSESKISNW
ncbi:hypothetical protein [Microcoleus sp. PH2017_30_WIL_O_A]|uniref:hypothetical protein n=1 Tax=Microcoleus sp. PH2017_30_WIL_O_A TaxID=2798840 RepID=UPI001D2337BD|nr:hypothetical protein [Microcoleus sp. PH2017_30_WIL_O_A]MCC3586010.1 hypothetical protein [Microcoleus sp. PH2017_30_WIL_O_A]